jgi:acyl carrier protein
MLDAGVKSKVRAVPDAATPGGVFPMSLPAEESATLEALTSEIIAMIEAEMGDADLTADTVLESRGLDSLKIMSLVFKFEARYKIHFEDEDADDLRTVGDLTALVVRRIQERS